jgi:hypothetical protein
VSAVSRTNNATGLSSGCAAIGATPKRGNPGSALRLRPLLPRCPTILDTRV